MIFNAAYYIYLGGGAVGCVKYIENVFIMQG